MYVTFNFTSITEKLNSCIKKTRMYTCNFKIAVWNLITTLYAYISDAIQNTKRTKDNLNLGSRFYEMVRNSPCLKVTKSSWNINLPAHCLSLLIILCIYIKYYRTIIALHQKNWKFSEELYTTTINISEKVITIKNAFFHN